jgi:hypothetical protein
MSAYILGAVCHEDPPAGVYHYPTHLYAISALGSWSLQRLPHQLGRWFVSLQLRGLMVDCHAVQDDFGDLQMVAL